MAMRIPISRVRSVTETSMMFMMPMPPTSSEMLAHHTEVQVRQALLKCIILYIKSPHQ